MHIPSLSLYYYVALVDEGFAAYTVRGEGLSGEVDDIVMYLVVAFNYET